MTAEDEKHVSPNDVLVIDDNVFIVSGVFLGGLKEDSLVGLHPHSKLTGHAYGKNVEEYFTPEPILRAALKSGLITHHKAANPND